MRSLTPLLIGALLGLPTLVHTQERTAGGSLQQEASWSALTNLVNQANASAKTANVTANEALRKANLMEVCSKKGMIYAPGVSGVDTDSCLSSGGDLVARTSSSYSTGGSKVVTLSKTPKMAVSVSCSSGKTIGAATATIKLGSAGGWKTVVSKRVAKGCADVDDNCSNQASGSFSFYERAGTLYSFDSTAPSASGKVAVTGSKALMNFADWNGTLSVSGSPNGSCSVSVDQ